MILVHQVHATTVGPGGGCWLDANDPALFDAWLTQEMERPYRLSLGLRMVQRPDNIPAPPPDTRIASDDEDALY